MGSAPSRATFGRCTRAIAAVFLAVVACSSGAKGASHGAASNDNAVDQARVAARHFLSAYVEPDGRVARHDQGDDTVSEGQSYALLLAQVAGDEAAFDRVWQWTSSHLARRDGLLSSHAARNGQVDDPNAATDADVLTAWALLRDVGPLAVAHHQDGRGLAAAILDHETLTLPDRTQVLAAGNWATGAPGTLNPSYWAIPALTSLARLTSDDRWNGLAQTAARLTAAQTNDGHQLPPDWERVDGATVTATPAPNGQVPDVRYSFDAQRVVTWFAVGGTQSAKLAAAWAGLLDADQRDRASALRIDGSVVDGRAHPEALIAAAAGAGAAGDHDLALRRLADADALDVSQPSYYGGAWTALGRALLTTDLLKN